MSTALNDKENKTTLSKIMTLLGASTGFYAVPSWVAPKKRELKGICPRDLVDYLYEWFCRKGKDSGFFHLDKIRKDLIYCENTVRDALRQIHKKGILLIKDLGDKNFLILTVKEQNKLLLEKVENREISVSNVLFIEEPGTLKKISNSVKSFFCGTQKNDSSAQCTEQENNSTEQESHPGESEKIWTDFIDITENVVNTELQEFTKQALDLIYLDPVFTLDHHQFLEEKNKNDDDIVKIKKLREEGKSVIPSGNLITSDSIIDLHIEEEKEQEELVQVFLTEFKPFVWNAACDELLAMFENLKNKAGQNVNFNLDDAEVFIRTKDHDFLRDELKAFPLRVDQYGNPVGAGYLIKLIRAGKSNKPEEFVQSELSIKVKQIEEKNEKVFKIFGINSTPAVALLVAKNLISQAIINLIESNQVTILKNKISEMKKYCNIHDFLTDAALKLIQSVKEPVLV
jgi:hypothetical protein